tara:strand:- start:824 stop:1453 length:630 start_codon:yes stop_codon:yes gene_type:complete
MNIFKIENLFYQNSNVGRISKLLFHYELYKKIKDLDGHIVECGVFKGVSLIRFLSFIKIFKDNKKWVYGFDAFGKFPSTNRIEDKKFADRHNKNLGNGLSIDKLKKKLVKKKFKNFKLIKGNILDTIDKFLLKKKNFKISLLHLDLDVFVATNFALEKLYPLVVKNGVIILDDYKHVSGTTRSVNQFLKKKKIKILKLKFHKNQSFFIK